MREITIYHPAGDATELYRLSEAVLEILPCLWLGIFRTEDGNQSIGYDAWKIIQ